MTTELMPMLELAVDAAGLVICLAAVAMVVRSRRMIRQAPRTADFRSVMDTRNVGQAADSAFSAIVAVVDAQRRQFMDSIEGRGASLAAAPADGARPRRPGVSDGVDADAAAASAPATLSLARKIRQRQEARSLQ